MKNNKVKETSSCIKLLPKQENSQVDGFEVSEKIYENRGETFASLIAYYTNYTGKFGRKQDF